MNLHSMCSGEPAALVPGGLRGYRMWNVRGALLTAISHSVDWTVPDLTATCQRQTDFRFYFDKRTGKDARPPHVVPSETCTCGIYGWYRPDDVRLHQGEVFGAVEATGLTLLGDFGFRTEKARIVALATDYEPLQHYWTHRGVPVFDTREALLREFPQQDVRELIGHDIPDTPVEDQWQVNLSGLTAQFTLSARQYQQILDEFRRAGLAMSTFTHHYYPKVAAAKDDLPEGPKERALALRRQGTRGPEKRRRGRARLELP